MTSTEAIIVLAYRANVSLAYIVETTGRPRDEIENLIMSTGFARDAVETHDLFDMAVNG